MVHPSEHDALARRLQTALSRLPERQREIFLAVRHEGASFDQLAHRHAIETGTVERELASALVALVDAADRPRVTWRRLVLRWLRRRRQP